MKHLLSAFVVFAALACTSEVRGQITSSSAEQNFPAMTPGHEYLGQLSETVNPADGSLSISIPVATPQGRGPHVPFSFAYSSNQVNHLITHTSFSECAADSGGCSPSTFNANFQFASNVSYLSKDGWGYNMPMLSAIESASFTKNPSAGNTGCYWWESFIFQDGISSHALALASAIKRNPVQNCYYVPIEKTTGGDDYYQAAVTQQSPTIGYLPGISVASPDGTVYTNGLSFLLGANGIAIASSLPQTIEDSNGNITSISVPTSYSQLGQFTVKDSSGRTALQSNGFGASGNTVTSALYKTPYTAEWTSNTSNYPTSIAPGAICADIDGVSRATSGISSVALPNGRSYTISYDPTYALVSRITYPAGGYVRYVWATGSPSLVAVYDTTNVHEFDSTAQPEQCAARYGTPVISQRFVSYDGKNEVEEQDFSYSTAFPSGTDFSTVASGWTSKSTTVTTKVSVVSNGVLTNLNSFKTTYNYVPTGIAENAPNSSMINSGEQDYSEVPIESSIQYYDTNGSLLKTTTETWYDQYLLKKKQTVIRSGAFEVDYPSGYSLGGIPVETDEYDFGHTPGNTSVPDRKTVNAFASFANTPLYPSASIVDKPSSVKVYAGSTLASETDYTYDSASVSSVSNLSAGTHDETNYSATATSPRGNATSITKKCLNTCTSATTTYQYDETGQMISKTDPCGNASCSDIAGNSFTTSYSYSDSFTSDNGSPSGVTNSYLTKIVAPSTNSVSHTQTFQYGFLDGMLRSSTDENSMTTHYCYWTGGCSGLQSTFDSWFRLTGTSSPDGGQKTTAYSDAGPQPSVTVQTLLNSSTTMTKESVYDGYGNPIQTQLTSDPAGTDYVDTVYDGEGRIYSVSNPHRSSTNTTDGITSFSYDALGRKIIQTQPDRSILQWCYDGTASNGQSNCHTKASSIPTGTWVDYSDEAGNHWQHLSDGLGRLVSVMEPSPSSGTSALETDYGYDALNDLLTVNQKGVSGETARTRSFSYDSLERLLTSTNPETGTICYGAWSGGAVGSGTCQNGYDANGNLITKTDARNVALSFTYDVLNRVLTKKAPAVSGAPAISDGFTYDMANSIATSGGVGRLVSTSSANGESEQYAFDTMGRMTKEVTYLPSSSSTARTVSAIYDLAGNTTSFTYPDSRTLTSGFDGAGRIASINYSSWNGIAISPASPYLTVPGSTGYDAASHLVSVAMGNGVTIAAAYDNRERIGSLGYSTSAGTLWKKQYAWTSNSNLQNWTDGITGVQRRFAYDDLNRLASAQDFTNSAQPGTLVTSGLNQAYGYDSFGDLLTNGSFTATYPSANKMSGYSYDSSGNLLSTGTTSMTWDAESKGISASGSTYLYNAGGERVEKQGGSVTDTIYFGGRPIARLNASNWTDLVYGPSGLLAEVPGTQTATPTYRLTNHLGTDVGSVGSNGLLTNPVDYTPFGLQFAGSTSDPYQFTGKERDTESGLDYFGARYYASNMGRFMSPDWSSSPEPVPYANLGNPQSLNLYSYVGNNPLGRRDSNGHCWGWVQWLCNAGQSVKNGVEGYGFHTNATVKTNIANERKWLLEGATDKGTINTVNGWDQSKVHSVYKCLQSSACSQALAATVSVVTQWGWPGQKDYINARNQLNKVNTPEGTVDNQTLGGKVPTQDEAVQLIEESGGKVERIEEGHGPNSNSTHQDDPHINYTTADGTKGTITIQEIKPNE